ncbi:MAG: hypothetical protein HY717_05770 [Planctomycetes bacterium]|nr:hypothetical protein [Planctomycetota bacterium]
MKKWCILAIILGRGPLEAAAPPLGWGIPADCLVYFHFQETPRWRQLRPRWQGIFKALEDGSFWDGLVESAMEVGLNPKEREARKKEIESWGELLAAVEWSRLLEREVALGVRSEISRDLTEVLALFRVAPEERARLSSQLQAALEGLAAVRPEFEIVKSERDGGTFYLLSSAKERVVQLCLGSRDDVIAIGTSARLMRWSMQLLDEKASGRGIVFEPDYDQAMGALLDSGAAERDFELLVRPPIYFNQLREVAKVLRPEELKDEEAEAAVREQVERRIKALDLIEWAGLAGSFDGQSIQARFQILLAREAEARGFYKAFGLQPPLEDLSRLVPKEAGSFFLWSGLDWAQLFKALSGLLPEEEPGAKAKRRSQLQKKVLELAQLLEGRMALFTLPGTPPAIESAALLKLRDQEGAASKLEEAVGAIRAVLPGNRWRSEMEDSGRGPAWTLREGDRAALVLARRAGELVAGTSAAAVEKARRPDDQEAAKDPAKNPLLERFPATGEGVLHGALLADFNEAVALGRLFHGLLSSGNPESLKEWLAPEPPKPSPLREACRFIERVSGTLRRQGGAYRGQLELRLHAEKGERGGKKDF